jgi:hypothetical protein
LSGGGGCQEQHEGLSRMPDPGGSWRHLISDTAYYLAGQQREGDWQLEVRTGGADGAALLPDGEQSGIPELQGGKLAHEALLPLGASHHLRHRLHSDELALDAGGVVCQLYGLVRPWVSRKWRQEIEIDPEMETLALNGNEGEEPIQQQSPLQQNSDSTVQI